MKKYIVSIWDEQSGYFQERAYKTSARALHRFFSICATEAYRNYEVVYAERLREPSVRNKTVDDYNEVQSATFLPLESIRPAAKSVRH